MGIKLKGSDSAYGKDDGRHREKMKESKRGRDGNG